MKYSRGKFSCRNGLSFIEVMVTLVVLSVGLMAIFRTFFISLDRMSHITNRLYISTILDNSILETSRKLKVYKALPMDLNIENKINVGRTLLDVDQGLNIKEVDDFKDVFEIDITLRWKEGSRDVRLSRSAYVSDF